MKILILVTLLFSVNSWAVKVGGGNIAYTEDQDVQLVPAIDTYYRVTDPFTRQPTILQPIEIDRNGVLHYQINRGQEIFRAPVNEVNTFYGIEI